MDKLAGLITNIELAIRYLLSGTAVYAIYLLGLSNPCPHITWIAQHPLPSAFVTIALGFTIYSIYRTVFWVVGDGLAFQFNLSAPSLTKDKNKSQYLYHAPYTKFLLWRREDKFDEKLNGYLHYRWAVTHFILIVALLLAFALINCEPKSIIDTWRCLAKVLMSICFITSLWQCSFLFRVERELYKSLANCG